MVYDMMYFDAKNNVLDNGEILKNHRKSLFLSNFESA